MHATALMRTLTRHLKSDFLKNVATVATGTASAQAVGLAFTPIITRLYGPEAYGLQGVFLSVTTLLGTVAALGYPLAIVLPRSDAQALALVRVSLHVGAIVCSITGAIFAIAGHRVLSAFSAESIAGLAMLVPAAMFLSVASNVQGGWLVRKKAFALTAKYSVYTAIVLNATKVVMGFVSPTGAVLIASNVLGSAFGVLLTQIGWRRAKARLTGAQPSDADSQEAPSLLAAAIAHRDFPLLRTPQNLINAFSRNLPTLLLSTYFGAGAAGQYSLTLSVLTKPTTLIGQSVMSVFYPRVNEAFHKGENARRLIVKATLALAATGLAPFLALVIAAPSLFGLAFGEEWVVAGEYARWLAGWIFFQYINRPAVSAIPALRLQGGLLVYEIFSTGSKVLALWVGFAMFQSALTAVALFSIVGVVAYVWLILWVIKRSGGATAESRS